MNSFTILVMGAKGVGKSTFINRMLTAEFAVGKETQSDVYQTSNITTSVYLTLTTDEKRHIDGIILMFDLTSHMSYKSIPGYYIRARMYFPGVPIYLVGNKHDAPQMTRYKNIAFHKTAKIPYCKMSVKSCYNLEKAIVQLVEYSDPSIKFVE